MAILVIGSSNTDLVAHAKSLPKPGETILGGEFFVNPGGKGANQAVGAARVGKNVTFCCMTGEDDYGKSAKALFEKEGIDTSYVLSTSEAPSGVALITVDENAENCIVVASGANLKLTPEVVDGIRDFGSYDIVLAQLETPMDTVEHIGELAKKNGVKFVLNPAPAAKLSEKLLSCIDIITPNETEAEIITGVHISDDESALAAAKCMHRMGVDTVIITLGSRGSLVSDKDGARFVHAFKVKAVDTTAAGDIFNGSLCVALSEGKAIDEAVRFASATASIAVTRKGAQASAPTRDEVEKVLNQ